MIDHLLYYRNIHVQRADVTAYLFIQGDVDREAKSVFEFDFVRDELADLFGGRCRVDRQVNGASVHQLHRHNHGLFCLGSLSQYRRRIRDTYFSSEAEAQRKA